MKKIVQRTLLSLLTLTAIDSAFALDSGTQNLTSKEGATDYFKINCAGDTDHLTLKLFENSANSNDAQTSPIVTKTTVDEPVVTKPVKPTVNEPTETPAQFFNAKLTKSKLSEAALQIVAGENKEMILKGGNGTYRLTLDTLGTNLGIKTAQTYSVLYQCINADEELTKGSSVLAKANTESKARKLLNNKTANFSIRCAKDKTNGNTTSLVVKVMNKTAVMKSATTASSAAMMSEPSGNVTAQVIKAATAKNTIGDTIDVQQGSGKYDVLVNSPTNKALSYHFEYSCLNAKNIEAETSPFQLLQDQ